MPIFREYRLHCTINGSWITSLSATAPVSRLSPRCRRPFAIGTFTQASGRWSSDPSDLLRRPYRPPDEQPPLAPEVANQSQPGRFPETGSGRVHKAPQISSGTLFIDFD